MRSPVILLAASLLLLPSAASAGLPLGGMTVAVSPDGKRLVSGGDTRTIVVMDPETLEVKDRIWVETTIVRFAFNQKGTVLAMESSDGKVAYYDTATWKKTLDLGKREVFSAVPKADLLAGWDADYNGSAIHLHSLTDGTVKSKFTYPKGLRLSAFGLNADGTRLAVLTEGKDDADEKKVPYNEIPKDLQGTAREDFVQHNDGKTATFYLYEVATGKILCEKKTFFTTGSQTTIYFAGADALVINPSGTNARFTPAGEATLFRFPNSSTYGIGTAVDQSLFMSGGMGDMSVTKADTFQGVSGKLDSLPGFPEYFKGFSATAGGAIYGATTGYRVVRFGTDGKVIKVAPIK